MAATSMEDSLTDDSVVGSVNPIGNASALFRVSGPTAVAIMIVPISRYAMVARCFAGGYRAAKRAIPRVESLFAFGGRR